MTVAVSRHHPDNNNPHYIYSPQPQPSSPMSMSSMSSPTKRPIVNNIAIPTTKFSSMTMSRHNSASSSAASPLVSPTGSAITTSSAIQAAPKVPVTRTTSWDDIMSHAHSRPCGGTALGSNVKGPCKPIGRTDGVVICWWCSRWLGTFETWNPPTKPPRFANVYDSDDDYADGFFA